MPPRKKARSKANKLNTGSNLDTGGGAHIGGDVTAGRDVIGRDYNYTVINNYPSRESRAKADRASRTEQRALSTETEITEKINEWVKNFLFPATLGLILLELLCMFGILFLHDLWPITFLPLAIIFVIHYRAECRIVQAFRRAGFYDNLTLDRRDRLKDELKKKKWGNPLLNLYTSLLLEHFIEINKGKLKSRCK